MRRLLAGIMVAASAACTTTTASALPADAKTLVIERVVVNETPQSGTWLRCFHAQAGEVENTFNVPDREYSGDSIHHPNEPATEPAGNRRYRRFLDAGR